MKFNERAVEDVNISYNQVIGSYVIDISYRETDKHGNVDIFTISDLPIPISNYYSVVRDIESYSGDVTKFDLGFGELIADPKMTKTNRRRIHTETKEMTIEGIEKQLGYSRLRS